MRRSGGRPPLQIATEDVLALGEGGRPRLRGRGREDRGMATSEEEGGWVVPRRYWVTGTRCLHFLLLVVDLEYIMYSIRNLDAYRMYCLYYTAGV